MRIRPPRELGDAMLVAAGVMMLVLFGVLYISLPPTTVIVNQAVERGTVGQEK